jgi:hypothetical protein
MDEEGEEKVDLEFQIKGYLLQELNAIARSEDLTIIDLLKSMFAYSITQVSDGDHLTLLSLINQDNRTFLHSINLDFAAIQDPSALFREFIENRSATASSIIVELKQMKNLRFKDKMPGSVVLFICTKRLLQGIGLTPGIFDLILEIDDTDAGCLNCFFGYNTQLNPALMEQFMKSYVNNLSSLLKTAA